MIAWTQRSFGPAQASAYRAALMATAEAFRQAPPGPGARAWAAAPLGLHGLHMRAAGQRGRHVFYFRAVTPGLIEVARILHDSMDPPRHLP